MTTSPAHMPSAGATASPPGTARTARAVAAAGAALLVAAGLAVPTQAAENAAPAAPSGLLVNSREHPMGVEGEPSFSWLPQDVDRGEVQTAYRLQVREDATGTPVWDSGKVTSDEQSFVPYAGPALEPASSYTWSVQTWDREGEASPTASGAFDTGLADEDWAPAQWIRRTPGGAGPMTVTEDDRVRVTGGNVTLAATGTDWTDYTLELTVRPTERGAGWMFRSPDRDNGYMWQLTAGTGLSPHVLVDGSFTRLGTIPLDIASGEDYHVRVELDGAEIRTFVDDELVDERTDTTFTAGTVGFRESSNEVGEFDDVLVSAPGGATLLSDDFSGGLEQWQNVSTERQPDEWTLARTEVELESEEVVRARAYVAGSHTYELTIDGERADRGQSFAYPGEHYYQTTDVTELLAGKETVAVGALLHWYGSGQGRPAVEPGLLVRIAVEYGDGSEQVIVSDGSWTVAEGPYVLAGRRNGEGEWIEHLDATRVIEGWDTVGFDDAGWDDAQVLGTHPTAPFTDLTGQLTRMEETEVPARELLVADDGTVVADFGVVIPARPVVRFDEGVAGRVVPMRASYELAENGRVSTSGVATQGTDMSFPYTQVDGAQEFAAFTHLGFRYLEIPDAGEDIALEDVSAVVVHTEMPEAEHASFASSDPTLDAVWDLMKRSALYSVQEAFVDTPTREKGQFLGDFVDISYATMAAFGERAHTQQGIREFLNSADRFWNDGEDLGRYNAVYPNGDGKRDIPDYALMFVDGVWRYYQETGDRALLAEAYPYMRQTAEYVLRHIPEEGPTAGLVTTLTGGGGAYLHGIVDWPAHGRFGYDMDAAARTTINAQGVDVLHDVARMAEALGETDEAAAYRSEGDALAHAMNELLRREDGVYIDGLHADGTPSEHAGQHSTSYAVAHGVAPVEDVPELAEHLAGMGMRQGPMTAHWLLQALSDAGHDDAVLERLTDAEDYGWANILAQGGTFTWEAWELEGSANSASHGWGAQSIVDIQQTLLGVRTAAPGAARIDVVPPDSALEHASGVVPTQRGPVSVDWERHDDGMRVTVDVPVNVTARVAIPITGDETYGADAAAEDLGVVDGRAVFAVGSGETTFDVVDAPPDPGPLVCSDVEEPGENAAPREAVLDTLEVGTTWAGHYVGQALLTDGEDQYVGYYDENRELTVAHRKTDSDEWTHQRLGSRTGWDSHNYITLATDPTGNLHVTGNMHNVPLLYWRTTTPGDVTTLEPVATMVDPELESRVTYPVFLELEDGTVVFRYREGGSGNGIDIYNEYDAATQTWHGLLDTPLLDGEGERNAYAAKPRLGPDGSYHMVWVWRETPIASTTHTVSYARSADLVHWETSQGEPMPLPITLGTSDVVDPVEPEGGTINNNVQVGFDGDGAPVVAYHRYDDEGNTQVYVARPDESGWETVQVSDWTGAWDFSQPGTLVFEVELYWAPEVQPDGNLRLDVTCQGDARTFIIDAETLEPISEIASPPTEPAAVSAVRSDYVHPVTDEAGTEMQVNLNDDSGAAGSFHARPLLPEPGEDLRHLLRWESLGENQDRPRQAWPEPQPIEVVVLGTEDACRDGGWSTFSNPGFESEADCVAHVQEQIGTGSAVEVLAEALAGYVAAGDVSGPIAGHLAKALDQAQWHLEAERTAPAERALERFIRHLDNPKRPDTLGADAQSDLRVQAEAVLAALGSPTEGRQP